MNDEKKCAAQVWGCGRHGVEAAGGGQLEALECRVLGNPLVGVNVFGGPSFSPGRPPPAAPHGATRALIRGCVIEGSRLAGVDVRHANATVSQVHYALIGIVCTRGPHTGQGPVTQPVHGCLEGPGHG